jgi:hypothetical protein
MQGAPGKRCGKHYFEIDFTNVTSGANVGVRSGDPSLWSYGIASTKDPSLLGTNAAHVGVAVDLDAAKVFYRTAAGWIVPNGGTPVTTTDPSIGATTGAYLHLWNYDEVAPVVEIKEGSVHITRTAPFTFAQPTGYAADL